MPPKRKAPAPAAAESASEFERVTAAAAVALAASRVGRPRLALVLGSGLGDYAEHLSEATALPYGGLPHFPRSSVPGHAGHLWIGRIGAVPVVIMQGRVHLYEGYRPAEVVFGVRVMARMGVRAVCLTNAAGGIRADLAPGDLMRLTDHVNLSGQNPLVGPNDDRFGPRFPDLSAAYSPALAGALDRAAADAGVVLKSGVYCQLLGPSYETPAEIRAYRALGVDAVGMSTVPEVIAARHLGLDVAALSCITNRAAGLGAKPLVHADVADTAARVRLDFGRLLDAFVAELETD
ncbi:MAG TPA: purine-nucleoside phosphorylase [Myxococcales bacterium]|nr:purine-nucleoside phosphorylase [Myxococcales bacterium]